MVNASTSDLRTRLFRLYGVRKLFNFFLRINSLIDRKESNFKTIAASLRLNVSSNLIFLSPLFSLMLKVLADIDLQEKKKNSKMQNKIANSIIECNKMIKSIDMLLIFTFLCVSFCLSIASKKQTNYVR